ncbi:MAG: hypothetical protein HY047_12590 [Acidobacteria bacterium]|nr:hypothetical protein [Acidobacteriota bacterium]
MLASRLQHDLDHREAIVAQSEVVLQIHIGAEQIKGRGGDRDVGRGIPVSRGDFDVELLAGRRRANRLRLVLSAGWRRDEKDRESSTGRKVHAETIIFGRQR